MAATYDPKERALVFFDADLSRPPDATLTPDGAAREARVVSPIGRVWTDARTLPLHRAVLRLATLDEAVIARLAPSEQVYARAARLVLSLVARGLVAPRLVEEGGVVRARHHAAREDEDVARDIDALARAMPRAAHATPPTDEGELVVFTPHALITAFIDDGVDALVRASMRTGPSLPVDDEKKARLPVWCARVVDALVGEDARVLIDDDDPRESASALVARVTAGQASSVVASTAQKTTAKSAKGARSTTTTKAAKKAAQGAARGAKGTRR